MKKTLLSFILFIFLANGTYSQNKTDSVNSLRSGKWGIQFELGSYVNPNYFEAVMFALKPVLSNHFAVKLGVSYDFSNRDGNDMSNSLVSPSEIKNENATVVANGQYYFNPHEKIIFYLGLGMIYKYDRSKSDYFFSYNSVGNVYSHKIYYSQKKWSAGAIGMLGIEWFLVPRISIIAEYDMTLTFGKYEKVDTEISTSIYENETKVDTEYKNVGEFRFNIAKLGISAYF
jgi:hypothetical protein